MADADWFARGIAAVGVLGNTVLGILTYRLHKRQQQEAAREDVAVQLEAFEAEDQEPPKLVARLGRNCRNEIGIRTALLSWEGQECPRTMVFRKSKDQPPVTLDVHNPDVLLLAQPHSLAMIEEAMASKETVFLIETSSRVSKPKVLLEGEALKNELRPWRELLSNYYRVTGRDADQLFTEPIGFGPTGVPRYL